MPQEFSQPEQQPDELTQPIQEPGVDPESGVDSQMLQAIMLGGIPVVSNKALQAGKARAIQFGKDFKHSYKRADNDNNIPVPKTYGGFGGTVVDAALSGDKFDPYAQVLPLAVGTSAGFAYNSAPPYIINGFNLTHGPVSALHPGTWGYAFTPKGFIPVTAKIGFGLTSAASASTGADVGSTVYNDFLRDRQNAVETLPGYNKFWGNIANNITNITRGSLAPFDPAGKMIYGKNWDAKKQRWADETGATITGIPMGLADTGLSILSSPLGFRDSLAAAVSSEPKKWHDWFHDTLRLGGQLIGPGGKVLSTPQFQRYIVPWLAYNTSTALSPKGSNILYTPENEPDKGPDFSGYTSRFLANAAKGNKDAINNDLLSIVESRPGLRNMDTLMSAIRSGYWYTNNKWLNPANWNRDINVPAEIVDPSINKSVKERFGEMQRDAEVLKDTVAPYMKNFYNASRDISEGKLADRVSKGLIATWNSFSDAEKQTIRELNPEIDSLMANAGAVVQKSQQIVGSGFDQGEKQLDKHLPKKDKSVNLSTKPYPSVGAGSPGGLMYIGGPKEDRYFDWNNSGYHWPKIFSGRSEWLPGAPALNSAVAYPLAAIRDSLHLAKDRTGAALRSAGNSLRTGLRSLIPSKPKSVVPQNPSKPEVIERLPDGTILKHDMRLGRNSDTQVF